MSAAVSDNRSAAANAAFDAATSGSNQVIARITTAVFGWLYLLSPLRVFAPLLFWAKTTYAFGYDDVRRVLSDVEVFATPFRHTMAGLDKTRAVSLLGFEGEDDTAGQIAERDADYRRNLCQIMRSLPLEDLTWLGRETAKKSARIVRDADEVDAVGGLLTPIVLELAQAYFGLEFSDPRRFHRWTMAISNFTFGGGKPHSSVATAARIAGREMDRELDCAIAAARAFCGPSNTVVGRLASMVSPAGDSALTDNQIRATVAGLLSGMLPNLPIAGHNVVRVLLSKPAAMAAAREAARDDDDDRLQRCIIEALRFRPIDAGRHRVSIASDRSAIGSNAWRRTPVPAGRRVFAATLPAMFDGRRVSRPFHFDPSRPLSDNLALGAGKHWCVGAPIAMCVLTQALKPLLRKPGLRRDAGSPASTYFLGFFPESFVLRLDERAP